MAGLHMQCEQSTRRVMPRPCRLRPPLRRFLGLRGAAILLLLLLLLLGRRALGSPGWVKVALQPQPALVVVAVCMGA